MHNSIIIIQQIIATRRFWDNSIDFRDNLMQKHQIIPKTIRFIPKFDFTDIL